MRYIEDDAWSYRCPECAATELLVEERYTITAVFTHTLPCDCGEAADGIAAQWDEEVATHYHRRALLDEEHHWDDVEEDDQDDQDVERGDLEIFCQDCYDESANDGYTWEIEKDDDPEYEVDEFLVLCAGCEREIEFGWSHPDRGGRIWPAECSDFNPWKCWPEPRFRERWQAKGWIRPGF